MSSWLLIREISNEGNIMHLNRFKFHPLSSVLLLILIFSPTFVLAANPETYSATLVDFEGKVWFQKPGEEIWLPVQKYMALGEGDRIKTDSTGYVEILMDDGSLLGLEGESEITLKELSADFETKKIFSTVSLWFGRSLSNIHKFSYRESKFEVQTSTAVAGVRGTEFIVETIDSERTEIGVFEGNVMVGGLDKSGKLIQGSEVLITDGNQTTILKDELPLQPLYFQERMLLTRKKCKA